MKKILKITLNSSDAFDQAILNFLGDKKNKSGQLKKLAYDRLLQIEGNNSNEEMKQEENFKNNGKESAALSQRLKKLADF